MKKILFGNEARQSIKRGIDKCCDVVKVSMGGYGQNVLIYNGSNTEVINDGVTIAHQVNVKDEVEQAGIQLAKQCANQTNEDAGDGTTTTLVLLQAVLREILPEHGGLEVKSEAPRAVRESLFKEAEEILGKIKPKQVKTRRDIYNLALTSSLDEEVANLIADIYHELGKDAQVSIEETHRNVLEKEILKGIKFESKRAEEKIIKVEQKQVLEDCDVLVLDKAEDLSEIQAALSKAEERGKKQLVVIANQFSRPVLLSMLATKGFTLIPVEYKMLNTIEDVKDYVGDGPVDKVVIEGDHTTLIGGKGSVDGKVELLKLRLEKEESQFERENLEKRISSLLGKIAVIRVGKNTDVERQEAVLKVEDALGAVKGAYDQGYVPGAGQALYDASRNASERMQRICEAPYKQIRENAGFDFETPEGVIDSFKTVKCSLMNALSTGTSILTAGAALIEIEEES